MSTKRRRELGELTRGPHGFFLCRYCQQEVMPPRKTFCSMNCIHLYRIQSDPVYAKKVVQERDNGVCAHCAVDTIIQHQELKKLWTSLCAERVDAKADPRWKAFEAEHLKPLGITFHRFSGNRLWDLDHVKEVAEGGGSCGGTNLATLCIKCHKEKTKKYMKSRKKS
jgi:5-methylcytosine-specific restriction protein A